MAISFVSFLMEVDPELRPNAEQVQMVEGLGLRHEG